MSTCCMSITLRELGLHVQLAINIFQKDTNTHHRSSHMHAIILHMAREQSSYAVVRSVHSADLLFILTLDKIIIVFIIIVSLFKINDGHSFLTFYREKDESTN